MNDQKNASRIRSIVPVPPFDVWLESDQMFNVLNNELELISNEINRKKKEQRWRRIFIRSLFSFIENCAYRLKQDARTFKKFPEEELCILTEKRHSLDDKGKVVEEKLFLKTLPNLKYAFNAFATAMDIDFKLNTGDARWENLKKSLKIRHRITHPKNLQI